jgi:hypothetical protein
MDRIAEKNRIPEFLYKKLRIPDHRNVLTKRRNAYDRPKASGASCAELIIHKSTFTQTVQKDGISV